MKSMLFFLFLFPSSFCFSDELPSEFKNDLVYLTPKLTDGTTITFFTDTGGGWNAISKELSDKYHWHTQTKEAEDGPIEVTSMPQFDKSVSIPGAGLNNWWKGKLQVVPKGDISRNGMSDGTLGGRWHAEKIIEFDYPNKSISVLNEAPLSDTIITVPLGFQKNEEGHYTLAFPRIDISVDGKLIPMLLDTGASAWSSSEAATVAGLPEGQSGTSFIAASIFDEWTNTHSDWLVIEKGCRVSNQDMIRVPAITVGKSTIGPVWFTRRPDPNFHQFMSSMMDRRIDGALGGSALKYLRIVVDYPNEQAYIHSAI